MSSSFADYFRIQDEHDPFRQNALLEGGADGMSRVDGTEDVLDVICRELGVSVPIDLDLVTDALRLERYVAQFGGSKEDSGSVAKSIYYLLRPLLPVSVRKHLQRLSLRGRENTPFPRWPVDVTVEQLMAQAMSYALRSSGAKSIPFVWFWPEDYRSCLIITHDVETAVGRDFCDTLMDIDESYGFKSAFQIVPERRYEVPDSFLDRIRERGCEVNIHGLNHDGRLFSSRETFSERAKKINEYGRKFRARGFRSPVLYRNAEWMSELDFGYEMSFPNVGHLDPQRGGCCTVLPYFIGDMVELPLTTMQDYSLFNILNSFSIDTWKEQINTISSNNGLISFNIHPDYLKSKKSLDTYVSLLAYLKEFVAAHDVWCALPGDVAKWWRDRSAMSIGPSGEVSGPNAELNATAKCMHACIQQDRLAYTLAQGEQE